MLFPPVVLFNGYQTYTRSKVLSAVQLFTFRTKTGPTSSSNSVLNSCAEERLVHNRVQDDAPDIAEFCEAKHVPSYELSREPGRP